MGQVTSSKYFTPPILGKKPPSRILAFRWGLNDTKKGPFYLTEESAKSIIANFEKNRNPIVFDLEHLSLDQSAPLEDKRALAYGPRLETDDDGLWVADVQYTQEGYELVETGKWGFTSPVFLPNLFSEVSSLTGMGFTNYPATRGARPLLLSSGDVMNEQIPMNNELISRVKPLRDMQSCLGACMNVAQEAMNTHINSPVAMMARKMSDSLPEWITAIAELLEQMDPEGLSKPEREVAPPKMAEEMMMPTEQMSEKDPKEEEKKEEVVEESPKEEKLSAELSDVFEACKELTGESNPEKVKAKLLALKHNLVVTEQALSEAKSNEKVLLVDAAVAQGKIPPMEKERFLKLSMEGIQTYLSAAKSKKELFPEMTQRHTQFSSEEMNEAAVSPEVRERVNGSISRIFARIGS